MNPRIKPRLGFKFNQTKDWLFDLLLEEIYDKTMNYLGIILDGPWKYTELELLLNSTWKETLVWNSEICERKLESYNNRSWVGLTGLCWERSLRSFFTEF